MAGDPLRARRVLDTREGPVTIAALDEVCEPATLHRLPFTLRILLEDAVRHAHAPGGRDRVAAIAGWRPGQPASEALFHPARVLLQDLTGVPAVVDLAAIRAALAERGDVPDRAAPVCPVDLVIDHSVQVDAWGSADARRFNVTLEFRRNRERYALLRWAQAAFGNLRVVPPGAGIVHQVNLEFLATVVATRRDGDGRTAAFADTVVGTDSHTPMIGGLGVLGWGVGGIEAEAVMLGEPYAMQLPEVVGCRLSGALPAGATATDLVLAVTQKLRAHGVVGKFVEFFGPGLAGLSVPDRATLANMAPEYGATVGFFPVDGRTLEYMRLSGRTAGRVHLVEAYCRRQGLWRQEGDPDPEFSDVVAMDLGDVVASLAGPKRPEDRLGLADAPGSLRASFPSAFRDGGARDASTGGNGGGTAMLAPPKLRDGDLAIAAITSCTNTSNPSVMVAAGLLARAAVEAGLRVPPHVKTSMAPGSRVVTAYLEAAGLLPHLEALGFQVVGYGCTTCIGNSGDVTPEAAAAAQAGTVLTAVLSGNRNFEARIHPAVRGNYLASPPLVVAYALAGTMDRDLTREPIGEGRDGRPIHLADIWPSPEDVQRVVGQALGRDLFQRQYADVFRGDESWEALAESDGPSAALFAWDPDSTYIRRPPFLDGRRGGTEADGPRAGQAAASGIEGARVLVMLGDAVTTDHISPAGAIAKGSEAARYLTEHGVAPEDWNTYGARRGNHEVMVRGTFGNTRLRNALVPGREGPVTLHLPSGQECSIYGAAMRYRDERVPLLVIAGRNYGNGSSRDWAAKGPQLLGVRAVIAVSFERIHRSNLIGMGVLPLEFAPGQDAESLQIDGRAAFSLRWRDRLHAGAQVEVTGRGGSGTRSFVVTARLDTPSEVECYYAGGILPQTLRRLGAAAGGPGAGA